ncbi:MAG TPA: hypothetical protein VH599_14790 [Ktedonobacterales bacterium]|jgi:hypothetical protein
MLLVAPPSWRPAVACWSAGLEGARSPGRSGGRLEGTRERPTGARMPRQQQRPATERSEGECGNWAARATNGSESAEAQPRQAAQAAGQVPARAAPRRGRQAAETRERPTGASMAAPSAVKRLWRSPSRREAALQVHRPAAPCRRDGGATSDPAFWQNPSPAPLADWPKYCYTM